MKKDLISYESYAAILAMLEREQENLEREFRIACRFIPNEEYTGKPTGIHKALEIYRHHSKKISDATREFKAAAKEMYRNHPSAKMRKFWCVK